jgi:RNA polymerase sigma-70 factor, ECF subfamily
VSFPVKPQSNEPEEMIAPSMIASIPTSAEKAAELPRAVDMNEDVALFRDFLAGDDVAAIKVFRTFHRRIFVYCAKVLGSPEQAEDVVGEVWERVVKLRSAPPEVHSPIGFLLKIARNLCLNHIRSRRDHLSLSSIDEAEHPASAPEGQSEMEERLIVAMETLPFETREILVLNAYCGYRFDEIATMLDKSPEAVWARASRARAQLRRMVLADGTKGSKRGTGEES